MASAAPWCRRDHTRTLWTGRSRGSLATDIQICNFRAPLQTREPVRYQARALKGGEASTDLLSNLGERLDAGCGREVRRVRTIVVDELLIGRRARHAKPLIEVRLNPEIFAQPEHQLVLRKAGGGERLLECRGSVETRPDGLHPGLDLGLRWFRRLIAVGLAELQLTVDERIEGCACGIGSLLQRGNEAQSDRSGNIREGDQLPIHDGKNAI